MILCFAIHTVCVFYSLFFKSLSRKSSDESASPSLSLNQMNQPLPDGPHLHPGNRYLTSYTSGTWRVLSPSTSWRSCWKEPEVWWKKASGSTTSSPTVLSLWVVCSGFVCLGTIILFIRGGEMKLYKAVLHFCPIMIILLGWSCGGCSNLLVR